MNIIAVYPGRFQPFHKGHAQVYKWLKEKFGNAHIATSNKVEAPKSPFNFDEKKTMMELAGVSPSDITEVRNPYIAPEILRHYDGTKTVLVFAISEKDMAEDPRFSFKPTKSGKPGYLQPYPKDGKGLEPFGDPDKPRGYVVTTPTFTFNVLGEPAKSATEVRKQFANADHETQKKLIKDLFGKYDAKVHKLMDEKIKGALASAPKPVTIKQIKSKAVKKTIKEDNDIGELNHEKFGPMLDTFTQFASKKLGIKSMPKMALEKEPMTNSFGGYNPSENSIVVISKNRHPMDVFRTVAHELVHHKQNEDGRLGKDISNEGATGSDIENEANSEAGKIMRWYAKSNPSMFKSGYVTEERLAEGINDPSTFKAVFLAGGPGSGKDYVMKQTLDGNGLQEINSDVAFEYLMRKAGLDFKMPDSEKEDRDIVRGRGKNMTKERQRLAIAGRRGVIINGTADDPEKIVSIKKELESLGYDTMMVFVDTADNVSKERNIQRGKGGGREVPEDIRKEKWEATQNAKPALEKVFGKDNFVVIDNSEDIRKVAPETREKILKNFADVFKKVRKFAVEQPIKNPGAADWIGNETQRRGITDFKGTKATAFGSQKPAASGKVQQQQDTQPNASEMEQAKRLGLIYLKFGRWGKNIKGQNVVTHISQNGQLVAKPHALAEDLRKWFSKTDPEGGWKRINSKGEAIGPCAREPGEPKPKCMSNEKRAKLTKKERASAVRAKREHDPNPERKGEPINVSNFGKGKISESSTEKYLEEKNVPTNPELWSRAKSMARSKFDVYPSAYANGWASKWYKSKGGGWKSQTDESFENFVVKEEIKDKMSETKKTKKVLKKKLNKEDNSIALGYEFGNNGIGDQFGVIRSPSGLGFGYSLPMSEAKTFTSIRENWEAIGGRDMGTISKQDKEEMPEQSQASTKKIKKLKEYVRVPNSLPDDADKAMGPVQPKNPMELDPKMDRDPDMMQHYRDNPPVQKVKVDEASVQKPKVKYKPVQPPKTKNVDPDIEVPQTTVINAIGKARTPDSVEPSNPTSSGSSTSSSFIKKTLNVGTGDKPSSAPQSQRTDKDNSTPRADKSSAPNATPTPSTSTASTPSAAPKSSSKPSSSAGDMSDPATLIKKREGYISQPKWDVNAHRAGYGSDTVTRADGTIEKVKPGMSVSREDADRDLQRRIPEFQKKGVIDHVGQDAWDKLHPHAKSAVTSLAYNYGSIGKDYHQGLRDAIKNNDNEGMAREIEKYKGHNNGINAGRRQEEADIIRGAGRSDSEVNESSPAWQRSAGKNPEGGLNKKGIASYRAEHPGSKLSLAVTEKPSELKAGSKKAKRRLSFCRRMKGMKAKLTSAKTAHDPDSRINKSLRKWNCEE